MRRPSLEGPSRTAVMSAVGRALHLAGPPPHVLCDRLASDLAGADGATLLRELRARLSDAQLTSFCRWTSVRARFVEDLVEAALAAGVDQYVILGAGLDSFAYRRQDVVERMRVFEVDHPSTQAWKLQRLTALSIEVPQQLTFVPVDFEREVFPQKLADAGHDSRRPSVISWIGVTMYLSLEAIEDTLGALARFAAGSRVVMSYDMPARALTGLQLEVRDTLAALVADLGEPFVTTFEQGEVESMLRGLGFDGIVHFGPTDAIDTYFDGARALAVGGSQRLVAAAVPY